MVSRHSTRRNRQATQRAEYPTKNVDNYVVEGEQPVPKFEEFEQDSESLCDWSAVPGLGDIIVNESAGRMSDDGITVFYNRGMGIQFAAIGKTLYEIAEREELEQNLSTELFTQEYHLNYSCSVVRMN